MGPRATCKHPTPNHAVLRIIAAGRIKRVLAFAILGRCAGIGFSSLRELYCRGTSNMIAILQGRRR